MKRKLTSFSISLLFVIIIATIFTLLFSLLATTKVINKTANDNAMLVISLIIFLVFGFVFGYKEKNRGLVNGLILIILYLIGAYTFKALNKNYQFSSNYIIIARCGLLLIGSIIGVNISQKLNP